MTTPGPILVLWPLQVPAYFNAGHHLALYQVAGHLRRQFPGSDVHVIDGSVERLTWRDLSARLHHGRFSYVAIMNDLDGIDGTSRSIAYVRELCPNAQVVSFGRLSSLRPSLMESFDVDAIVASGDLEPGVAGAIRAFTTGDREAPGVRFRAGNMWRGPASPGIRLPAAEWYLPLSEEIPYDLYDDLYADDARRFSGLAGHRELVVPVARGCPVNCSFCEVPTVFGRAERRLDVDRVVDYIQSCFASANFDYVSFYSPTFTLDRAWTRNLCARLSQTRYRWKCCTTISHLDESLVDLMAEAGCVRISVGLETTEESTLASLPRVKANGARSITSLAAWCRQAGVELNCFVIAGLPGATLAGVEQTVRQLLGLGVRVRPTIFTAWEQLRDGMSEHEISLFNRQIRPPGSPNLAAEDLRRLYGLVLRPDTVAEAG